MNYQIVLVSSMAEALRKHLLSDRSREQMAVTLCGVNKLKKKLKLLVGYLILLPRDAFKEQSSCYLELKAEVQRYILKLAASERLSQVDWHSHPGESSRVDFSGVDDLHEARLASYLDKKIPGTFYGSVVVNRRSASARIWQINRNEVAPKSVDCIRVTDYGNNGFLLEEPKPTDSPSDECFSRQVLAFGEEFQRRLSELRVGLIGHGGLGSIIAEQLTRLGVFRWVVVDDDCIEISNLNRLPGAVPGDAKRKKSKVALAQRNIFRINPRAKFRGLVSPVGNKNVLDCLKGCDLLIVGTDNHSSRLIANRLSVQYLIPLVHAGVNIDVDENRKIIDISGEFAIPPLGEWCLQCAGIIDPQLAGWELADEEIKKTIRARGYVQDTPAPAVYHLNGVISSLAVAEIHNFVFPYKPVRRYLAYDELKAELLPLNVSPRKDCPVCNSNGGVLGLGDLIPLPDYEKKNKAFPLPEKFDSEDFKRHLGEQHIPA
jgi:hypothetical protein